MVVEVEYQTDELKNSSFMLSDEDERGFPRPSSQASPRPFRFEMEGSGWDDLRETPGSPRCPSINVLRQSANLHTSLLNVTSDTETESTENDEDDFPILDDKLEDDADMSPQVYGTSSSFSPVRSLDESLDKYEGVMQSPLVSPPSSPRDALTTADPRARSISEVVDEPKQGMLNRTITNATEVFFESLCPVPIEEPCGDIVHKYCNRYSGADLRVRSQMELDVLALLGCLESPTADEEEVFTTRFTNLWNEDHPSYFYQRSMPQPTKVQQRAQRIHRIRKKKLPFSPANIPQHEIQAVNRSLSMDEVLLTSGTARLHNEDSSFQVRLESLLFPERSVTTTADEVKRLVGQQGSDPMSLSDKKIDDDDDYDEGYDSDPEPAMSSERSRTRSPTQLPDVAMLSYSPRRNMTVLPEDVSDIVEESLNYTWTLTWHPDETKTKKGPYSKSTISQVWLERGSLLNQGTVVVEPKIMWRRLTPHNPVHVMTEQPHQVRMLCTCRILPMPTKVDRSKYPLCLAKRSFLLKVIQGDEYVFEASSEEERNVIITRWRCVIARLATLAVLEDMESMAAEFFTTLPQFLEL